MKKILFREPKTKRRVFALAIILCGIIVAVSISASGPKKSVSALAIGTKDSRSKNPYLEFNRIGSGYPLPTLQKGADNGDLNLTDTLAESYLAEILRKNPSGPQLVEGEQKITLPGEQAFGDILDKYAEEIGNSYIFEEKDIKLTNNVSKEAGLAYLQKLNEINEKNFGKFDKTIVEVLDLWMKRQNSKPLEQYVSLIQPQTQDLLALPVPILWKQFHLQNLNLWQKKLKVYSMLLDLENDPLASVLALGQVSPVIEETLILNKILEERFLELNKKT